MRAGPRIVLLVLVGMVGGALPGGSEAGEAGTLDRLVVAFDGKLQGALKGLDLPRMDLALALRQGPGATPRLALVIGDQLQGRLVKRPLRSVSRLAGEQDLVGRAGGAGIELLLDVELQVVEGHLRLLGKLLATDRNLWRDTVTPRRGALNHLHASVRVDAEVRAYLGRVTSGPLRFSMQTFQRPGGEVLALATGDVDGEGRVELVLLRARGVTLLRYRRDGRGFTRLQTLPLPPPLATLRPRRSMGSLVAADLDGDGRAEVLARSSEMARGALLDHDGKALAPAREIDGYPLARPMGGAPSAGWLAARAQPGRDLLDSASLAPQPPAGAPAAAGAPGISASFYHYRALEVPRQQGGPLRFAAAVDAGGRLQLWRGDPPAPATSLSGVGLAFDLADLDDDGALELVTTGAGGPGSDDRITVRRLDGAGLSRPRWQSARLEGRVTALTHGDLDGDGKLELVAAVSDRRGQQTLVVLK